MNQRAAVTWGAYLAGTALGLARPAAAQQTPPRQPRLILKANLLPLLVRGYHLEAERAWAADPRYSLGLTIQGYHGAVTALSGLRQNQPGEVVRGYGLELLLRRYLPSRDPDALTGFYVGAGPQWQHFQLHFQEKGYRTVTDSDGFTFYQYGNIDYTETIRRLGAAAVVGYQGPLAFHRLTLDFYAGIGWRNANYHSALPRSYYRSSFIDYGATGVFFPVGFKLGFSL